MTAPRVIRATLLFLASSLAANAQVVLRAGERIDARVAAVSEAGVELDQSPSLTIPWDRVVRVEGRHADAAKPFADLADRAWRARSRLERADVAMAAPLFEELFLQRIPGPTGAVIARGALRCRLDRGALASAVAPWIDAHALRAHPTSLTADSPLASVIDPVHALVPTLPPIFLNDDSALYLVEHPIDARDDPEASALALLYTTAARAARSPGAPAPPIPALPPSLETSPSLAFVRAIVVAQHGSPADQPAARSALLAIIHAEPGSFREAWARVALARSLASQSTTQREAVLHYLHLPARFGRAQPYLTGVALAEASRLLATLADLESARTLRDELAASMPRHPALAWLDRTRLPAAEAAP